MNLKASFSTNILFNSTAAPTVGDLQTAINTVICKHHIGVSHYTEGLNQIFSVDAQFM